MELNNKKIFSSFLIQPFTKWKKQILTNVKGFDSVLNENKVRYSESLNKRKDERKKKRCI